MILKNNYLISNILPKIQQLGKSLLIPIGLLSVLGICVVLNEAIKSDNYVNTVWTIFHNLPIIFAICVGYGMSDDEGGGALASFLIYFVSAKVSGLVTGAEAILIANGPEARSFAYVLGIATLSTGSFGGILSGILGAITFKQANNTKFIPAFSFYSGARFVPILACIYGAIWGLILPFIWIPIAKLLLSLSFIANVNPIFSVFFFGTTERLLIPFGLHRILNPVFWYEIGNYTNSLGEIVRGDYNIFIAMLNDGIKSFSNSEYQNAAKFIAGSQAIKMFGLPGAAFTFYKSVKPENRKLALGIYGSAALTSFLTGITEPIEFTFLFIAPLLYIVHSIFTGISFILSYLLGIRMIADGLVTYIGFGVIPGLKGFQTGYLIFIPYGIAWFFIYYFTFKFLVSRHNWQLPGMETLKKGFKDLSFMSNQNKNSNELATKIIEALGSLENISTVGACATRLRVEVFDNTKVDDDKLKELGATNVLHMGEKYIQAIFGGNSQFIANDIKSIIKNNSKNSNL